MKTKEKEKLKLKNKENPIFNQESQLKKKLVDPLSMEKQEKVLEPFSKVKIHSN